MAIQNRLLLIYTVIFTAAFILFAAVVYLLPRNIILAQIDNDLEALASEVRSASVTIGPDGSLEITIPENLANFETASTFAIIADAHSTIIARTGNLRNFAGFLDPAERSTEKQFRLVRHGNTLLRVLTVPLTLPGGTEPIVVGHLQVARLLDFYESFNRLLAIAMLMGFAAATASLFLAVWLTPSLFKPLEDIAAVARQISRADDLSRRVPDHGRTDEIGILARALNQTLERLERLFQAQQRLLADVSHELRTPLTTIRGNLDLMQHMGEADPESMAIIQEEIERLTRMVGDLLLLARADAGGLPLERKPVEMDTIFLEVYRQVKLLASSVKVTVTAVDQVCVLGDSDRLKQLLLNLVDNAIKYTPPGGTVSLSLSKTDGWARLDVTDTGIGIPPEDLPLIFDRFYRVDKARSRGQGGSGLGLSIARWIAQAHGGTIQVFSTVGEGSTFTVKLPLWRDMSSDKLNEEAEKTRPSLRVFNAARRRSG